MHWTEDDGAHRICDVKEFHVLERGWAVNLGAKTILNRSKAVN